MEVNLEREILKLVYRSKPAKPEELRRSIPNIAKYLGISKEELTKFFVKLHEEVLNETKPLPGEKGEEE